MTTCMRIISLSPSITETLFALSLEQDLVGVTDDCSKTPSSLRRVGNPKALHADIIAGLKPDLLIAESGLNRPDEIRNLKEKFHVISYEVVSMPSLIRTIGDLGEQLEVQENAKKLIRHIYAEWNQAPKDPVKSLILLWNTPFLTVSANTYASNLIEAAGGINVFRQDPTPEVAIEIEDMIDQSPDLILLPQEPFPFTKKDAAYFQNLPPFARKRVRLVDGYLFSRFGPRTVSALKVLKALMQEAKVSS
jgi:iron complex transport system substrate-binding protein